MMNHRSAKSAGLGALALAAALVLAGSPSAHAAKPLPAVAATAAPAARAQAAVAAAPVCPPPGFDSLAEFDLAAFAKAGPWYSIMQNEVFYQPKDSLYCVRAAYVPRDPSDLTKGVSVLNTANRGGVTGAPVGSSASGGGLMGIVAFPDAAAAKAEPSTGASKLRVLPSFLEGAFRLKPSSPLISGPYWIVAAAPDMSWALISGGAPTNPSNGKCRTGRAGAQSFLDINGSGLWVFSTDPLAGAAGAAPAVAAAAALGYDTSTLLPVTQLGCKYPPIA